MQLILARPQQVSVTNCKIRVNKNNKNSYYDKTINPGYRNVNRNKNWCNRQEIILNLKRNKQKNANNSCGNNHDKVQNIKSASGLLKKIKCRSCAQLQNLVSLTIFIVLVTQQRVASVGVLRFADGNGNYGIITEVSIRLQELLFSFTNIFLILLSLKGFNRGVVESDS